jgi:penicillin-binding protein 1A
MVGPADGTRHEIAARVHLPSLRTVLSGPALRRALASIGRHADQLEQRLRPLTRHLTRRRLSVAAVVLLLVVAAVAVDTVLGSPGRQEIRTLGRMPVATVILDRNDKPAFTLFEERRYEVPLAQMSPHLVQAVLAIEDRRFYDHRGLDLWRIVGSAWSNLRSGSLEQGGSTITQQLAKLSWLTPEKTIRRKLREAYLAVRIEFEYSKEEILEIYLNKVYFGDGLYGAEAAARGYFGKRALDLSVAEAALLAGLIQRPSAYAPDRHPDRAVARRAVVLNRMASEEMIDPDQARTIAGSPLILHNGFEHERVGAYFKQAVTRELVERFGWETIARDGLRVFSTYDPSAQMAAEQALIDGLAAIEKRSGFRDPSRGGGRQDADELGPDYLQGAVVALDPSSGAVRALVGGRDFADSQFDRVNQAERQSGSAFKPFVYAAAFERGYSPATLITGLDRPIPTPQGLWLPDEGHDVPEAITIRAALRTSSNRAAAQLLQSVGISHAVHYASQMGLAAPAVPSLVLGTGDVTLMGLTAAYGVFASGGELHQPILIRRVENRHGDVLLQHQPASQRVISRETAFQMSAVLADTLDRGTGYKARQAGFKLPAAGKTGTTNDYRDAWFVGYTPDLVAGVWVGFDRPRTIVSGGYASELAVPIWGAFMRDATKGLAGRRFERPPGIVGIEVCQDSGLLPGTACRRAGSAVAVEYFRRGTEPDATCPLHEESWFGGVHTVAFDPSEFPRSSTTGLGPAPPRSAAADGKPVAANDAPSESGEDGAATSKKRGFWSRLGGVFGR